MPESTAAFEFLSKEKTPTVPAVCVLFGDEPLLKRESLERLRGAVLTGEDGELSLTVLDGKDLELREVLDELATVAMFGGGKRLVVVEEADKFVSKHREELEDYCQKPRPSSVLILEVDSWPGNTRLFKKVAEMGLAINCNLPGNRFGDADEEAVLKWLTARAKKKYQAELASDAGQQLLEIVGPQLGRLDQELAKLAPLAGARVQGSGFGIEGSGFRGQGSKEQESGGRGHDEKGTSRHPHPSPLPKGEGGAAKITRELVEQAVGGWRAKTAWAMIEAALDGRARWLWWSWIGCCWPGKNRFRYWP